MSSSMSGLETWFRHLISLVIVDSNEILKISLYTMTCVKCDADSRKGIQTGSICF